jgi:hypothetical protein
MARRCSFEGALPLLYSQLTEAASAGITRVLSRSSAPAGRYRSGPNPPLSCGPSLSAYEAVLQGARC